MTAKLLSPQKSPKSISPKSSYVHFPSQRVQNTTTNNITRATCLKNTKTKPCVHGHRTEQPHPLKEVQEGREGHNNKKTGREKEQTSSLLQQKHESPKNPLLAFVCLLTTRCLAAPPSSRPPTTSPRGRHNTHHGIPGRISLEEGVGGSVNCGRRGRAAGLYLYDKNPLERAGRGCTRTARPSA